MNRAFLALVIGALLVFGCIGGSSIWEREVVPGIENGGGAYSETPDASPGAGGQMVVKTGSVRVLVPQGTLEDKFAKLKMLAVENGGDVTGIAYNEYSGEKAYTLTLRLDPKNFDAVLAEIKLLGDVKGVDTNLEDVSTQYRDLGVRIANLRQELDALNALYNRTDSIEDILKIRGEIGDTETKLELYEQQKLDLERRASKATISVYVYEEKPAVETGLLMPLGDLAGVFFGTMGFAITAIVAVAGFLIPGAIALGALYGAWRLLSGKGK